MARGDSKGESIDLEKEPTWAQAPRRRANPKSVTREDVIDLTEDNSSEMPPRPAPIKAGTPARPGARNSEVVDLTLDFSEDERARAPAPSPSTRAHAPANRAANHQEHQKSASTEPDTSESPSTRGSQSAQIPAVLSPRKAAPIAINPFQKPTEESTARRETPSFISIPFRHVSPLTAAPEHSSRTDSTSVGAPPVDKPTGSEARSVDGTPKSTMQPQPQEQPEKLSLENEPDPEPNESAGMHARKPTTPANPPDEGRPLGTLQLPKPTGPRMIKSSNSGPGAQTKVTRPKATLLRPAEQAPRTSTESSPRPQRDLPTANAAPESVAGPSHELAPQGVTPPQGDVNFTAEQHEGLSSRPTSPVPMNLAQIIDAEDLELTAAIVDDCLKKHLSKVQESHAYKVRACLRRQRTCFERDSRSNAHPGRQASAAVPSGAAKFMQTTSPFQNMLPFRMEAQPKGSKGNFPYVTQELFTNFRPKSGKKSAFASEITRFRSMAIDVPSFREYVSLQDNVLAENETTLLNWPYFLDEEPRSDMEDELMIHYKMKNHEGHYPDLRSAQYQFYHGCIETFLWELGVGWQDVLYWFLASDSEIKGINDGQDGLGNADFEKLLLDRRPHCEEKRPHSKENCKDKPPPDIVVFDRNKTKWKTLLLTLPVPSTRRLRLSVLACSSFLKQCNFSLWHLARRCDVVQKGVLAHLQGTEAPKFDYRSAACRVCQL